jgi:thiol-disulfide isomerase/thioredoxin
MPAAPGVSGATRRRFPLPVAEGEAAAPRLRLYTTMATWCAPCRAELPQFRRLRDTFDTAQLALTGVPIDALEAPALLDAWEKSNRPAYTLLRGISGEQAASVKNLVVEELDFDAVPASLVTDAAGRVLHAQWGPPTVSRIRALLRQLEDGG